MRVKLKYLKELLLDYKWELIFAVALLAIFISLDTIFNVQFQNEAEARAAEIKMPIIWDDTTRSVTCYSWEKPLAISCVKH